MTEMYHVLHYKGRVDPLDEGEILGYDEVGREFEVIDCEYDPDTDRTTVNLQYATVESLRRRNGQD